MAATMADQPPSQAVPAITRVQWAPVPRVNLLPAEIFEGRRFKRVQRLLGLAVVAASGVAAAGVWWSQQEVAAAEDRLEVAQSRTTVLQQEQRAYAEVPKTIAQVQAAKDARAHVMGNDVLWYQYLTSLTDAAPEGVSFDAITFRVAPPVATDLAAQGAPAASSTDPLTPPGVGSVTVDGVAGDYRSVAAWLEAVDKVNGLDASFLTTADRADSGITYASGVTLTAKALSNRYDEKAG